MQHAYIIAELSANHNQSIDRAKELIALATKAGANAIKLQTYTADTMTVDCDNEYFKVKGGLWDGRTLYDLYQEAYTPWEWHKELKDYANSLGLDLFSTPFDPTSVDFLESLDMPIYKVASFEVVDIPLLKKIAQTKKPVIMSTGMANLAEIEEAVTTLRNNGTTDLTLLKCTSAYPASPSEANLLTIPHLAQTFNCKVGLSDHTLRSAVAVAAVALGAKVIEKHFTHKRSEGGVDSAFSMEYEEFKQMVKDIRIVEQALGKIDYSLGKQSTIFRRSLFVVEDVSEGEEFTPKNVRSIRPSNGLLPRHYEEVLGKTARKNLKKGTPLTWDML